MPEYQRLVSYIYLYDKGIKIKNSGFAKIECKDDILRIKMNLKGAFNMNDQWKVYLLTEGNHEILGIYVGNLKGKGASAEFQMVGTAHNIGESTKSFDELKGLAVVSSGSKKYVTFWKDTDIGVENFSVYDKNNLQKNDTSLDKDKSKEKSRDIYQDEYLKAMSVGAKEESKHKSQSEEETQVKVNQKGVVQEEIAIEEISNTSVIQDAKIENSINIQEENLEDNWNVFLSQYKQINPFPDKYEIECIKIELKDLKILPKSQWILSSNSFVLHGYYNYQYLILGKLDGKFILGVPGVFCNKEKLVAGLFGFDEFKPAQVAEYKNGRFGYWYKFL
ncbi:MAG: DUF6128 domain-containing protein [Lachnotalea sp.]